MLRSRVGLSFKPSRARSKPPPKPLTASQRVPTRSRFIHSTPTRQHVLTSATNESSLTSTVNEAEIAHFSRLSSLWWDERGEFGLLHKMNPARMQFIREKILESARDEGEAGEVWAEKAERDGKVLRGMDVLDVGCGGGILSEVCPPTFWYKDVVSSSDAYSVSRDLCNMGLYSTMLIGSHKAWSTYDSHRCVRV